MPRTNSRVLDPDRSNFYDARLRQPNEEDDDEDEDDEKDGDDEPQNGDGYSE